MVYWYWWFAHTGSQVERGSREAKYHRESIHESKCDHSINRLQFIEPFSDIHQILLSRRIWYQEQYKYCCYDGPQDHKHCYFHLFCNCGHGNEEWCMQGGLCRRGRRVMRVVLRMANVWGLTRIDKRHVARIIVGHTHATTQLLLRLYSLLHDFHASSTQDLRFVCKIGIYEKL